ncbi:translation initiation factor eIF-2B subunit alpha, partial [Ascosphaera acerosa]
MAGQELPDRSKDQALELHDEPFNIVDTYYALLESDPELTMPIAAIEALVNLLTIHPSTTMAETLALIEKNTAELKASIPNSISLSAGTDLFQRYIVHSLNKDSASDFGQIREHLLKNGKKFVQRAKASRDSIANFGRSLVREDSTVMTIGGSRVVSAMLKQVARSGHGHGDGSGDAAGARNRPFRFKVIYVIPGSQYDAGMQKASGEFQAEGLDTVRELRELQ